MFETLITAMLFAQAPGTTTKPSSEWIAWAFGMFCVFLIFVLPFLVSGAIGRFLRMPTHANKIGVMLATIIAGGLVSLTGELKYGIDIRGGTILVYDIVKPIVDGVKQTIDASALASALSTRLNPSGTKEMSIRPSGDSAIEIVIPMVDEYEVAEVKRLVSQAGQLQFKIVANTRDHVDIIEFARQQSASEDPNTRISSDVKNKEGKIVGRWFTVGRDDKEKSGVYPLHTPVYGDVVRNSQTGVIVMDPPRIQPPLGEGELALEQWLKKESIAEIDMLMAQERASEAFEDVSGDDLSNATFVYDKQGTPAVDFNLTAQGASKMMKLTSANQPTGGFHRRMAIILDGNVLSAPQLNSPISSSGQITGNFTREEADFLVTILRAGRLPATLSAQPVGENRVGAGLGEDTISKGYYASLLSVILTFLTILAYYRFSGIIASIALLISGLLVYGSMVLIHQPLTLPGLAGLVLTVGMSVDANVLIYERIREEVARGAAPRMAIRNGFERALSAIVDSNLTTIISAVVLYWIGTDTVRGFAVALIIGIVISMFTAIFCSRIIFDVCEKTRFINLGMADFFNWLRKNFLGDKDIDFMGMQRPFVTASAVLVGIGILLVALRGSDILDIDFTGGTSVTLELAKPVSADNVRNLAQQFLAQNEDGTPVQVTVQHVEFKEKQANTVYKLDTSLPTVDLLKDRLTTGFSQSEVELVTYRLKILKQSGTDKTGAQRANLNRASKLVALQDNSAKPEPAKAETAVDTPAQPIPAASTAGATTVAGQESATAQSPASTPSPASSPAAAAVAASKVEGEINDNPVEPAAPTNVPTQKTKLQVQFAASSGASQTAKFSAPALTDSIIGSAKAVGLTLVPSQIDVRPVSAPQDWNRDATEGYSDWNIEVPLDQAQAQSVVAQLESQISKQPVWLSVNSIGGRVAKDMQQKGIGSVLISLIFIGAYIWFRFQKVSYGLAAVLALVHDVLITLGAIAVSHWLAPMMGFLLLEDFKVSLTIVAALLTVIGYSLNDTIVIFDRIREVRGKSARLTKDIINKSVNQTLSRTVLTGGTTLATIVILYIFGGEGIHGFAYALFIGILVGSYSSIFIASPILLWLAERELQNEQRRATQS